MGKKLYKFLADYYKTCKKNHGEKLRFLVMSEYGIYNYSINSGSQISRVLLFLVCFFIYIFYNPAWTQECRSDKSVTFLAGFLIGRGAQKIDYKTYNYNITTFQGTLEYYLYDKNIFNISLIGLPQVNKSKFKSNSGDIEHYGYELGLNLGILFKIELHSNYNFYGGFGIGPHYITETPNIQASGFIFSDNIYVGMSCNIYKTLDLNFMYQFRHVSNAGLKNPNLGINNTIFSLGVRLKILDTKYSFENSDKTLKT